MISTAAHKHPLDQFLELLRTEVFGMNEMIRELQKNIDTQMLDRLQQLEGVAEAARGVLAECDAQPAEGDRFCVSADAMRTLAASLAEPNAFTVFPEPFFGYEDEPAEREPAMAMR